MGTSTDAHSGLRPVPVRPTAPARYAVGMFGTSLPINMFLAFMAYFYINDLGMSTRAYAAVLAVYAVIDAVDNPAYGYLSDRTRTRWGRRRPWMIVGAPVLGLSFVLFFTPPDLDGWTLVAWFALFVVLTGTTDSLVNANYGALLPELFPVENRRAVANSMRQGFQLVAMILSVAMVPMVADKIGYSATAMILAVVAVTVIIVCATGAREDPAAWASAPPRLWDTVRTIFSQRKFWLIALAGGAYSAGMALVIAAVPFFVDYTLGLPSGNASYLLASVIGISAACLLLWTRLVRRHGPERMWRMALVVLAGALALMSAATGLLSAIGIGALVGLGYSGVMATNDLIVARLLDEDAARTGNRREGMFLAAFGFFNRLNAWIKSLAFLAVWWLFGFDSGDNPGSAPDQAARFLISVFPAVLVALAALLSLFVRFDRRVVEQGRAGSGADSAPSASEVTDAAGGEFGEPQSAPGTSDSLPSGESHPTGEPGSADSAP
ncbi:MFS transporter [Ruania albidiflava]|uniref:MFS transporter n=1 Tax=Ruania albidiflava TaxID=366586 RepID=UPI0023F0E732|nr:MFS transporter [Ruania albidiflava]